MLEHALIAHCAPTLARLKPASLFTMAGANGGELAGELRSLGAFLRPKGMALTVLRRDKRGALFYLYRPGEMARILASENTKSFLRSLGYEDFSVPAALRTLRARLRRSKAFPHEIGVFLGYPLSDVTAFICNGGKNCLLCGCWKVYSNAREAAAAFARFHKCKETYARLFQSGCPLSRLAVGGRSA